MGFAHQIHQALSGQIPEGNPFAHVLPELTAATSASALVFAITSVIRNQLAKRSLVQ